ncbi:hypothetical protein [Holdemania massiliensis]|uniref:hypothetical protein n=1 Tax=Holdemania massiliensis TaxID=1468449 RepID=UPI001F05EF71|nr:hypothetical protein [Holdemania massiliensis]MCH1939402.1 hypothetical protein [Holdemania massiliensis]
MRKSILFFAIAFISICSVLFFLNGFIKENKNEDRETAQVDNQKIAHKKANQNKVKTDSRGASFEKTSDSYKIDIHSSYVQNESMELGEFRFDNNFIQSDSLLLSEYEDRVYFRGLGGNLLCYNGTKTEVILNEVISNIYQSDQFLTCLLEDRDQIVLLDLKENQYKTFPYSLPFNKKDCWIQCLYHVTNDSCVVYNLTDKDNLYVLDNDTYSIMTEDALAAHFKVEDSDYYLYNGEYGASGNFYENSVLIDQFVEEIQVVDSNLYYLKNKNVYGGYLVENYLMKYDTQNKKISQLVKTPVISFLATEMGVYYSLDPTCFKEKPISLENADELRMNENRGVYFLSSQGMLTQISNELYSGFQNCQYGLIGIIPLEDTIEIHLINEPTKVLDKLDTNLSKFIQHRWKYNESF